MATERTKQNCQTKRKSCADCGASMVAVDQREENGALFTWYECTRNDCDGQWLEKHVSAGPVGA